MSTYSSLRGPGRTLTTPAPAGAFRFPVAYLSRRSLLFGTAAALLVPVIGTRLVHREGWVLRAEDI